MGIKINPPVTYSRQFRADDDFDSEKIQAAEEQFLELKNRFEQETDPAKKDALYTESIIAGEKWAALIRAIPIAIEKINPFGGIFSKKNKE